MSVDHNFKYLLARMAFEDPARFLMTFAGDDGPRYLRDLWNGLQLRARGEDFEPSEELDVEVHGRFLVLRLPPSATRGSALALGVTGGAEGLRVFALERGDPDSPGELFVVEVVAGGRSNSGALDYEDGEQIAAFVARVGDIVEG